MRKSEKHLVSNNLASMIRPLLIVFPLHKTGRVPTRSRTQKSATLHIFLECMARLQGQYLYPGDIHVEFGEVIETTNNKFGAGITVR
jgi:hypothetical protein